MNGDPDRSKNYKRILLKISGEALGNSQAGIDPATCQKFAKEIAAAHKMGTQIAIVCGGGNIFRGINADTFHLERTSADAMGMLATMINGIALTEFLRSEGLQAKAISAVEIKGTFDQFNVDSALDALKNNAILVFCGGTGHPFFSTDTAAALRALQIKADILVKATKVDGVFDKDPMKFQDAKKFDIVDFNTVLQQNLKVMDSTAIALCREQNLPILVFNMTIAGNLEKAVAGTKIGTLVTGGGTP